jgi:chromate reductase, NAD(P)H dehydrogenase (quinone)
MLNILAIPGSLRADSSSNMLLKEISRLIPSNVTLTPCKTIGELPAFNDPATAPPIVTEFREMVSKADAILIVTPEYAFGIPGALKNAIDWTVGTGEFVSKPLSLITASSSGEQGHAAMLLVLKAISANVIMEASLLIGGIRSKLDKAGSIKDQETRSRLSNAINVLIDYLHEQTERS